VRPLSAIADSDKCWIADSLHGLSKFSATGVTQFVPNGPPGIASGEMSSNGRQFFAAAGSINDAWQYQRNHSGVFRFSNNEWSFYRFDNT
ncbi:hypothetical protein, partial [Stenotrophomonas maltophilia]|uniref:hypothetical protein n=1 Tax=Stenotrophomonas maltophilia TaxID=40324 RepID=UPI001954D751